MTVEEILADFDASLFYITLIALNAVYDILTIPIICLGLCTSCGIRVDVGNMCDMCSRLVAIQPLKTCHQSVSIISLD